MTGLFTALYQGPCISWGERVERQEEDGTTSVSPYRFWCFGLYGVDTGGNIHALCIDDTLGRAHPPVWYPLVINAEAGSTS